MKDKFKLKKDGVSYWLSYSDMMAALILMLTLIITISLVYLIRAQKGLNEERAQASIDQSVAASASLAASEAASEAESYYDKYVEASGQYEEIMGVRKEIVQKLKEAFKNKEKVKIDENTGDIILDSKLLFEKDKSEISKEGKEFLNEFFPEYIRILMGSGVKENISEIIIEGHTDQTSKYKDKVDGYIYNMGLSQDRATSVLNYCLQNNYDEKLTQDEIDYLMTVISANGKSFSVLKKNADGSENEAESRRVELKFRLAEENQIEQMMKLFKK